MFESLQKKLGFPYSKKLEREFKEDLIKLFYKPLLGLLIGLVFFLSALLLFDIYVPDLIGPPAYLPVLMIIHVVFFFFTLVILGLSVFLRKQFVVYPNLYFFVLNTYAIGICIWGSVLAAYADYPGVVHTAYGYITLILALVLALKPWQAIALFFGNFLLYGSLLLFVFPGRELIIETLANAGVVTVLGIVIASMLYSFRVRNFYARIKIEEQVKQINEINAQLLERVHIDGLTGLRNRRFFDEVLPNRIEELKASQDLVCGIIFDIDYFKDYNDRYGHQAGDVCLRTVAQCVDRVVSAKDTYLVRYGGEEFFVLAAVPHKESAEKLAERIRCAVDTADLEHLASERGHVTISLGIALLKEDDTLESLTKNADDALYVAKERGRNQVALTW